MWDSKLASARSKATLQDSLKFEKRNLAHAVRRLNKLLCRNAKRSALRGGPCVALTQPLPRALIKYTLPEQAWKEYLRSYQGSWFQGFLERP